MTETLAIKRRFDPVAMTLHWLVALMLIAPLALTWSAEDLPPMERSFILSLHSGNGIALFFIVLFRLYWRRKNPPPPYPSTMSPRLQKLAHANVYLLYALLLYQPLIGFLHAATHNAVEVRPFFLFNLTALLPSGGFTQIFHVLHAIGALALLAAISIHIAAAIWHFFYRRDKILQRMTPFARV